METDNLTLAAVTVNGKTVAITNFKYSTLLIRNVGILYPTTD